MKFDPNAIKENFSEALQDVVLLKNIGKATKHSLGKRANIVQQSPDWESWRTAGSRSRRNTLLHLDRYLNQFTANFTKLGGEVLQAKTIGEARKQILDILRSSRCKTVVKAKSMVTEELELAGYLNQQMIETWETDLGEFIIQLAGEHPTHITAPAIHKNRVQIAQLFQDKLKVEYSEDPEKLTQYARRFLREKYLKADAGISGANLLIAETGQVILVENEANIRLSTVLPKIHIAITGIEKVVPTQKEFANLMRLLPTSATGQKMAGYVSALTPGIAGGPERMIVILLNAGRRDLLNSDKWEMLACIRCGACLNVCPVFNRGGGHAYGSVYPGPMGAVLTPGLTAPDSAPGHAFASSLCGACADICPVKIPLPELLVQTRRDVVADKSYRKPIEHLVWKSWSFFMRHAGLFQFARSIAKLIPLRLRWGNSQRKLPRLARQTFLDQVKNDQIA